MGHYVIVRKFVVALSVAVLLAGSVSKSKAFDAAPVAVVASGSTVGAGVWIAGGVVGVAAALCAYDLILKFQGLKNWDGSEKVVPHVRHHRH